MKKNFKIIIIFGKEEREYFMADDIIKKLLDGHRISATFKHPAHGEYMFLVDNGK